jgi:hypothetical protein
VAPDKVASIRFMISWHAPLWIADCELEFLRPGRNRLPTSARYA